MYSGIFKLSMHDFVKEYFLLCSGNLNHCQLLFQQPTISSRAFDEDNVSMRVLVSDVHTVSDIGTRIHVSSSI